MAPDEEWRSAPGYPDYEVSSLGRARRIVSGGPNAKAGKILKPTKSGVSGYLVFGLYRGGRMATKQRVNRLICRAFHGEPPTPSHHSAHRDGDQANNCASNVYWATATENAADRKRHGHYGREGYRNTCIDGATANLIRELLAAGKSGRAVSAELAVSYHIVADIRRGKTWRNAA